MRPSCSHHPWALCDATIAWQGAQGLYSVPWDGVACTLYDATIAWQGAQGPRRADWLSYLLTHLLTHVLRALKFLLEQDVDLGSPLPAEEDGGEAAHAGQTAFHICAMHGQVQALEMLLQAIPDEEAEGRAHGHAHAPMNGLELDHTHDAASRHGLLDLQVYMYMYMYMYMGSSTCRCARAHGSHERAHAHVLRTCPRAWESTCHGMPIVTQTCLCLSGRHAHAHAHTWVVTCMYMRIWLPGWQGLHRADARQRARPMRVHAAASEGQG